MILYNNGFIKLDYNPSTDILYVKCPDVHEYDLLQVYQAFNIFLEAVTNYDIKKCILDTSDSGMDVSIEGHNAVMNHLANGLMATRLQRLARINTKDADREKRVKSYVKKVKKEANSPIVFKNFISIHTATDWLMRK